MNENIFVTTFSNFVEIQQTSFCWFLIHGLSNELNSFSSILNYNGCFEVRFFPHEYILTVKRKQTYLLCKRRNSTYGLRIYFPIQIIDRLNHKVLKKRSTFIGEIPLMTNKGTFIVNGCERVIINQIIRAPGIYYKIESEKKKKVFHLTLIFNRGSWLSFELDKDGYWVRLDKQNRSPIFDFLDYLNISRKEMELGLQSYQRLLRFEKHQKKLKLFSPSDYLLDSEIAVICSRLLNKKFFQLGKIGRKNLNNRLNLKIPNYIETITLQDIFAIIDYFEKPKTPDKIDSLQNRRLRSVGESIQNQFSIGLNRLYKTTIEKVTRIRKRPNTRLAIINSKSIISTLKEFFGSSQLSHYLDQVNPLSELANKRRISGLGPGGLNIEHVSIAARDIQPSQYGRICPIETPEGQNVGLVGTLACYAKTDSDGFIETPYFQVKDGKVLAKQPVIYLNASEEKNFKIAAGDVKLDAEGYLKEDLITALCNQEINVFPSKKINFISISPIQIISVAAALIPFLEHDDANRALMGANMQRQAVPLLNPQRPIIGTGLESQVATDSGLALLCSKDGVVIYSSAELITIKDENNNIIDYSLTKYQRSNQDTCINQKPIVWIGEKVKTGQIIADGPSMDSGELALGQNLLIAYMPWEGYNYEDAVLISDKLVYQNILTSIHIEKYETEVRETSLGSETVTREIPFVPPEALINLDENGIIQKGVFIKPGDIIVGKVAPNDESDQMPEARLLKAIFGYEVPTVRDTSMRVPTGIHGRVISISIFGFDKKTELPQTNSLIKISIAQIRKIQIGDKIAGRHGNKGVISKILPHLDMPFLPDGRTVDIILSPLGVPSRMNVGQIFECLLGLAGDELDKRFKVLPFDEMYENEASRILVNQKLREGAKKNNKSWLFNTYYPGKVFLTDGRTGEKFDNPILVGKAYILKLVHLVDDKIHARSTGPYSLITQQPVGGRSQNGGQRFGEMEVWALEAFGAAYTLQELLTVKSDDIDGRNEVFNCIIRGEPIPDSGIPESFKVLISELQSLGLNIQTHKLERDKKRNFNTVKVNLMKTYEKLI